MKAKIIDFIRRNRVSTTEVADCLGKSGVLENVLPINRGHFKVGNIKWVYAYAESNWDVHEQIISTEENDIVFIEAFDCKHRAIIGELVCKYLLLYRQASAIICNAKVRDAGALLRENYPIWCTGFTPVGCFNTRPEHSIEASTIEYHKAMYEDAIAVCDDCGVVVIPKELHKHILLVRKAEDIYYHGCRVL